MKWSCSKNKANFDDQQNEYKAIFADSTPTALTMSEVSTHAETLQGLVTTFLPLLMAQTHCLGPQLRSGGGTFFLQPKLDLP